MGSIKLTFVNLFEKCGRAGLRREVKAYMAPILVSVTGRGRIPLLSQIFKFFLQIFFVVSSSHITSADQ
jgi:hypothetical protein